MTVKPSDMPSMNPSFPEVNSRYPTRTPTSAHPTILEIPESEYPKIKVEATKVIDGPVLYDEILDVKEALRERLNIFPEDIHADLFYLERFTSTHSQDEIALQRGIHRKYVMYKFKKSFYCW